MTGNAQCTSGDRRVALKEKQPKDPEGMSADTSRRLRVPEAHRVVWMFSILTVCVHCVLSSPRVCWHFTFHVTGVLIKHLSTIVPEICPPAHSTLL